MPTPAHDSPAAASATTDQPGLTSEEDAELRRMHELMPYAAPDSRLMDRYDALRKRDRRGKVRELSEDQVAHVVTAPQQRQDSPR